MAESSEGFAVPHLATVERSESAPGVITLPGKSEGSEPVRVSALQGVDSGARASGEALGAREATRNLKRCLIKRCERGQVVLFEVPLGSKKDRNYADAISIGMWPSTGHAVHGYELKVSRLDLKRELDRPEKSAKLQAVVDYFWLAVPDMKLIRGRGREVDLLPRIPEHWGILAINGVTLRAQRPAKNLGRPADLMSRRLAAALIAKAGAAVLETVELVPTGTRYQQKRKRRSTRKAA